MNSQYTYIDDHEKQKCPYHIVQDNSTKIKHEVLSGFESQ